MLHFFLSALIVVSWITSESSGVTWDHVLWSLALEWARDPRMGFFLSLVPWPWCSEGWRILSRDLGSCRCCSEDLSRSSSPSALSYLCPLFPFVPLSFSLHGSYPIAHVCLKLDICLPHSIPTRMECITTPCSQDQRKPHGTHPNSRAIVCILLLSGKGIRDLVDIFIS